MFKQKKPKGNLRKRRRDDSDDDNDAGPSVSEMIQSTKEAQRDRQQSGGLDTARLNTGDELLIRKRRAIAEAEEEERRAEEEGEQLRAAPSELEGLMKHCGGLGDRNHRSQCYCSSAVLGPISKTSPTEGGTALSTQSRRRK